MTRVLVIGHRGLVGRALFAAAGRSFDVDGIGSDEMQQPPPRGDLKLVINAGGQIWGDAGDITSSLVSAAKTAIRHARRSRCPVLHIGSSLEYGLRTEPIRLDELAQVQPQTPYAEAKVWSWNLIRSAATNGAVALRCGLILSNSLSPQSLLGKVHHTALIDSQLLNVPASVLAIIRNPVHVNDLADATLAIADRLLTEQTADMPDVLNCGGEEPISVCELANQILEATPLLQRYTQPPQTYHYDLVSTRRLKAITGWTPTRSIRNGDWLK